MRLRPFFVALVVYLMLGSVLGAQHYYDRYARLSDSDSARPEALYLQLESETFFRNNEFDAEYDKGYTLPGYRLGLHLEYLWPKLAGINLQAGIDLMQYWGASRHPAAANFADMAHWTDDKSHRGPRLLPFFRAEVKPTKHIELVLGNIKGAASHRLISPLYNPELTLSADPELGVQARGIWDATFVDLWINWMSFIYPDDNHQESFTAGLSSSHQFLKKAANWQLEAQLQATATHRGGEWNWTQSDTVHTWINAAIGAKASYRPSLQKNRDYSVAFYLLGAKQQGEHYPYKKGWAQLTTLSANLHPFRVDLDYYYADSYVSPLGLPFCNAMQYDFSPTPNRKTSFLHAYAAYTWQPFRQAQLGFSAQAWLHLPNAGMGTSLSHTVELYLRFDPAILLFKRKK